MIAKPTLKMAMAAAEMLYSANGKHTTEQMYGPLEHVPSAVVTLQEITLRNTYTLLL